MAKMNRKEYREPEPHPQRAGQRADWTPPYGPHKTRPYPLLKLAKQGEVVGFQGGKIIPPLTPEEYSHALVLREAAQGGEDFRGMMASIEAAGFRIRPSISIKPKEEGYRLIGFTFTRDGVTLPAACARLRFSEDPNNPRALCLERDGPFLMRMRAAYDRDHAAQITARKSLLADIRDIENSCDYFLEAAPMLQQARAMAAEHLDHITMEGVRRERRILSLQRDGAEVRIRWANHPTVWKATRYLLDEAVKEARLPAPRDRTAEHEDALMEP